MSGADDRDHASAEQTPRAKALYALAADPRTPIDERRAAALKYVEALSAEPSAPSPPRRQTEYQKATQLDVIRLEAELRVSREKEHRAHSAAGRERNRANRLQVELNTACEAIRVLQIRADVAERELASRGIRPGGSLAEMERYLETLDDDDQGDDDVNRADWEPF